MVATHSTPDQRFIAINPANRDNEFAGGEASEIFVDRLVIINKPAKMRDADWFCNLLVVLRENNLECRDAVTLFIAITRISNNAFYDQMAQVLRS